MVMKWIDTLPVRTLERVFAAMRKLRSDAGRYEATARTLAPRYGEIAFGCGHVDAGIRGESLYEFLALLGRGDDPVGAADGAKLAARTMVVNWNRNPRQVACVSGQWENHRWDGMCDGLIEGAMRAVLAAAEPTDAKGP